MKRYYLFLFLILFFLSQVLVVEAEKEIKKDIWLLPDSPFYFLKEWKRQFVEFFTFDLVKQVDMELNYADEKMAELFKIASEMKDENKYVKVFERALNNYLKSKERLAKRLTSLEQNKNLEELTQKIAEKAILHQAIFDEILSNISGLDETLKEKVKMVNSSLELEARKLKTDFVSVFQLIQKLPYPAGVREFKVLEILTRIEENSPEETKKRIEVVKELIQSKLIETADIQKIKDWQIKQGISDWYLIEGVPVKIEAFKKVIKKLEEKIKEVNPDFVGDIWSFQKLENSSNNKEIACPTIAPDISKGEKECLKAAKYLDEIYPGCNYASACKALDDKANKILNPQKQFLDCGPAPLISGNWKCINGVWENLNKCGKIRCIRYDPVCGIDGKTYACGEADALSCGVKVAYKGECFVAPPLVTSSLNMPEVNLPQPIFCTQEWNPVCGNDNKTYSNECMAKTAGVGVKYKGECRSPVKY